VEKNKEIQVKVKEAKDLPEFIQEKLTMTNDVNLKEADIKTLCSLFKEVEVLCKGFLNTADTFERFLNSALYIKYRMTEKKEESLNASLAKSQALAAAQKAAAA
jgi:hypothetical protein